MGGQVEQRAAVNIPVVGSKEERLQKLFKLERDLTEQDFYGILSVRYEAGKVIYCRKEETIRL